MHDALQRQGEGPVWLRSEGARRAIPDGALRGQLRGRPHQPDPQHDPETQREFGLYTAVIGCGGPPEIITHTCSHSGVGYSQLSVTRNSWGVGGWEDTITCYQLWLNVGPPAVNCVSVPHSVICRQWPTWGRFGLLDPGLSAASNKSRAALDMTPEWEQRCQFKNKLWGLFLFYFLSVALKIPSSVSPLMSHPFFVVVILLWVDLWLSDLNVGRSSVYLPGLKVLWI